MSLYELFSFPPLHYMSLHCICILTRLSFVGFNFIDLNVLVRNCTRKKLPRLLEFMISISPNVLVKYLFMTIDFFAPGWDRILLVSNVFTNISLSDHILPLARPLEIIDFACSQRFRSNISLWPPIFCLFSNVFRKMPMYASRKRIMLAYNAWPDLITLLPDLKLATRWNHGTNGN